MSGSENNIVVRYELSLRPGSSFMLVFAIIVTSAIYLDIGEWRPEVGLYVLFLHFVLFNVLRFRVRRWLWKVMTAQTLPAPRRLSVPDGG